LIQNGDVYMASELSCKKYRSRKSSSDFELNNNLKLQ